LDKCGNNLPTARQIAGCGTQTAALAFGGNTPVGAGLQQKNMMEQLDKSWKYEYSKERSTGAGTSNCSNRFWWISWNYQLLQQQKNMMEQVGQHLLQLWQQVDPRFH
jgi:hypothetical protein